MAAILAAGGIAHVSPQFVTVRPTPLIDGVVHATFGDVNPGTAQSLVLRLTVPGGSSVVGVHQRVAGTPYAVLVEGGTPSAARLPAATDTTGDARWLARAQVACGRSSSASKRSRPPSVDSRGRWVRAPRLPNCPQVT